MNFRSYNALAIIHNNRMYALKKPLRLTVVNTGTYYYIDYPVLGIVGTGRNTFEAKKSFAYDFDFLYNTLFSSNDQQLTKSKKELKSQLDKMLSDTKVI